MNLLLFINWSFDAEIIPGFRTPNWYGLLFVSGMILGYFVIRKMFKQENIANDLLDKLVMYMVPATVIGARLGHVFFYGPYWGPEGYFSHPEEIFKIWEGGLASHGAAVVILFALWYFSPFVAFLIFLLFSAWHFGESDGESWGLKRTESFLWGLFFFYFLLGTHNHEAFQIVQIMTKKSIYWTAPWYALIPVMIYFTIRKKGTAALLCVWLYLATFLPLVLAFGLYFIIHHSHPSWKRIQVAISKT
ncbi:MAG: hypothetical protein RLZZ382_1304, partial [Bacteroidota bacterium]